MTMVRVKIEELSKSFFGIFRPVFTLLLPFLISGIAFAQQNAPNPAAAAGGAAACLACGTLPIVIIVLLIICGIAILVWVAKDAKRRGMDSPVIWMILVFFTNWVGLIIYILSRPKGNLIDCPNCKEKKLESLKKCPHCGQEG